MTTVDDDQQPGTVQSRTADSRYDRPGIGEDSVLRAGGAVAAGAGLLAISSAPALSGLVAAGVLAAGTAQFVGGSGPER